MRSCRSPRSERPRPGAARTHQIEKSKAGAQRQADAPAQAAAAVRSLGLEGQATQLQRASGGRLARAGGTLLQLQRWRGNRYVQQVVERASCPAGAAPALQPKLILGSAHDRYEREADRVAELVAGGGTVNTSVQGTVNTSVQQAIQEERGGGRPLPPQVRGRMERSLGADFVSVRLHTDARADQLNQALQSRAFTTGRDIFFRRGDYNPQSQAGRRLLAHELTHVVQQRAALPRTDAGASGAGKDHIMRVQRKITVHNYTPIKDSGRPKKLTAIVSGKPEKKGTNPTSASVEPRGYRKITDQYRLGDGDIFVKMHLLAGRLGGKNQEDNLIPGCQHVNTGAAGSHNDREKEVYGYLLSAKGQGSVEIKAKVAYGPTTDKSDGRYWWPKSLDWTAKKSANDQSKKTWVGTGGPPIGFPALEKEDADYEDYPGHTGKTMEEEALSIYGEEEII